MRARTRSVTVLLILIGVWLTWAAGAQAKAGTAAGGDPCIAGTWVYDGTVENPGGETDLPGRPGPSLTLELSSPESGTAVIRLDTESPIFHRTFFGVGAATYSVGGASDAGELTWSKFTGMPLIGLPPDPGPQATAYSCTDATLSGVEVPGTISPQTFTFTRFGSPRGPYIRGQQFERDVLKERKLVKNGAHEPCFGRGEIRIASNGARWVSAAQGGFSIPDAFGENCHDIVEIKDQKQIYNSAQFKRYEAWLRREGGCLDLVISPVARLVSAPLQSFIESCHGSIRLRLGSGKIVSCIPASPQCAFVGNRVVVRLVG